MGSPVIKNWLPSLCCSTISTHSASKSNTATWAPDITSTFQPARWRKLEEDMLLSPNIFSHIFFVDPLPLYYFFLPVFLYPVASWSVPLHSLLFITTFYSLPLILRMGTGVWGTWKSNLGSFCTSKARHLAIYKRFNCNFKQDAQSKSFSSQLFVNPPSSPSFFFLNLLKATSLQICFRSLSLGEGNWVREHLLLPEISPSAGTAFPTHTSTINVDSVKPQYALKQAYLSQQS